MLCSLRCIVVSEFSIDESEVTKFLNGTRLRSVLMPVHYFHVDFRSLDFKLCMINFLVVQVTWLSNTLTTCYFL